jgi:hypothetical protein
VRPFLGAVLHALASQRRSEMLAEYMVQDHGPMLVRIPLTYAVAEVVWSIKGKATMAVARPCGGRKRNWHGETFWATGGTPYPRSGSKKSRCAVTAAVRSSLRLRARMKMAHAQPSCEL